MTGKDRVPSTLAQNLRARGFTTLTPVQTAVLDVKDARADLLISAATGSGKTIAIGLALARVVLDAEGRAHPHSGPRVVILSPTRELATQSRAELDWLFAGTGVRIGRCAGGMDIEAERAALASGLDIVVASPGRLRDHLRGGALPAAGIDTLVLDEADDMLDMGFREDLDAILAALPATRQTLMVSATITPRIEALAFEFQRAAHRIDIAAPGSHADITFQAMLAGPANRDKAVVNVLRLHEASSALVFCGRRETVSHLAGYLGARGFNVVALSGDLPQRERDSALARMREGRARVCVATDVAARGIDLPGLDLVIHADLPGDPETLLHRSGRTGRAGRKGLAILIVPPALRRRAEALIARAGLAPDWQPAPSPEDIARADHGRLLRDPMLLPTAPEPDPAALAALTAAHGIERIAAAFLRLWHAGRPRAETLQGADGARAAASGIWFRIDRGQGDRAEVRRILPLICRLGRVGRGDIGRVRVLEGETHFEIRPSALPGFATALEHAPTTGPRISRLSEGM